MTEAAPLQQVDRTYVLFRGRKFSYFSGCDYYRLASHPVVLRAVTEGVARHGLNVAASRLTTGNHRLYLELERRLARFFGAEAALLVPTGYTTNLAVTQALAGRFTHALMDERAHVCLADAARFLGCPVIRFQHRGPADVACQVKRCGRGARIILLTDGMYARQGSAAPLTDYLKILPRDALLLVDDAHGAGVIGETGRGTLEFTRAARERIVQTITLSKALGVYGGAILCSRAMRRHIAGRSQLFAGSTPLPLPLVHAALAALRVLRTDHHLRRRLSANADYVKAALRLAGIEVPDAPGPIVAIHPQSPRQAQTLRRALLAAGILACLTRYPGGPAKGYYRFVISSEHTREQLNALIAVLCRVLGNPVDRDGRGG